MNKFNNKAVNNLMQKRHINGYFDTLTYDSASGWCLDDASKFEKVMLFIDGHPYESAYANRYREDLTGEREDGKCAFHFEIPKQVYDGKEHIFSVKDVNGCELKGSPRKVIFPSRAQMNELSFEFFRKNVFRISGVENIITTKKIVILAVHFKEDGITRDHQRICEQFRKMDYSIALIDSSGRNSPELIDELEKITDMSISRGDQGRDFSSWICALQIILPISDNLENIILLNDSNYGPYTNIDYFIEQFVNKKIDFGGLTDCWQSEYHLQSYFLYLTKKAFRGEQFQKFIHDYKHPISKVDIISEGEIKLSAQMKADKCKMAALIPYEVLCGRWIEKYKKSFLKNQEKEDSVTDEQRDVIFDNIVAQRPLNPTHYFWDILIEEFSFPFLKKELVIKNPSDIKSLVWLRKVLRGKKLEREYDRLIEEMRQFSKDKSPPPLI